MPIQTRVVPVLLAVLLTVGCGGDTKPETAKGTTTEPATTTGTEAGTASEAGTATTKAAGTAATEAAGAIEEAEAVEIPATKAYEDSGNEREDQLLEICWSEGKSADAASYKVSGNIKLGTGRRPDVDHLVLIATDTPISEWKTGSVVPIYSAGFAMLGNFQFQVEAAPSSLYVCAFAPPTFDDNQNFMAAGCTTEPITGTAGAASTHDKLEIVVAARTNPVITLGGARFGNEAWTGDRVQRTVSGTIKGVKAKGFVIATAPSAILDEAESTVEPLGMAVAGADGVFSLNYFSAPRAPLFVCAMGFNDAKVPTTLTATGCMSVEVTTSGGNAAKEFKDLVVDVTADSEELDADDAAHIALLLNCLGG